MKKINHEFAPYELSVKLKELGFDEECLGSFIKLSDGSQYLLVGEMNSRVMDELNTQFKTTKFQLIAPLWSQIFDWFREKHNLFCKIDFFQSNEFEGLDYDYSIFDLSKPFKEDGITDNPLIDYSVNETYYFKYEEARQACLEKLIELVTGERS